MRIRIIDLIDIILLSMSFGYVIGFIISSL
jgi:hypothetical protein